MVFDKKRIKIKNLMVNMVLKTNNNNNSDIDIHTLLYIDINIDFKTYKYIQIHRCIYI